jgi:hypothetical protein
MTIAAIFVKNTAIEERSSRSNTITCKLFSSSLRCFQDLDGIKIGIYNQSKSYEEKNIVFGVHKPCYCSVLSYNLWAIIFNDEQWIADFSECVSIT